MKDLIKPIDIHAIEKELNENTFARNTNNIGNEIYIIDELTAPNTLLEIGRLRELSFRKAGGGTGKDCDIDDYDLGSQAFKQLIVWDPEIKAIIGGYRYSLGNDLPLDEQKHPKSPTSHLFKLSDTFMSDYLPKSIELGRSFVQPIYQSTGMGRKGIFALDNLWDGLGLLIVDHPEIENFFGKITMYTHYPVPARNYILYFLNHFFHDPEKLVIPREPMETQMNLQDMEALFQGNDLEENYKILINAVREEGVSIPPLVNAYMKLSPSMKSFGTAINYNFGEVEETGILIHIPDIYPSKKHRHISNINRNYKK